MAQIKLSIAFVLVSAAIAPIIAQPIRDDHEFAGNVGHQPHHRHHHHQEGVAIPEQSSFEPTSDTTPPLSGREVANEFEVRSLLSGEEGILNSLEKTLEQTHKTFKTQNGNLERTDRHLESKERRLRGKDHRLQREGRKLEHIKHELKRKDRSLLGKKHRLLDEDKELGRKSKTLSKEDNVLESKHRHLLRKDKALGRKDKMLGYEGHVLAHNDQLLKLKGQALQQHDGVLAKDGQILAHKDKALAQEGKALGHRPVIHSEPKIVNREYATFDEIIERADPENIEPGAKTLPHFRGPLQFGHGPVVHHLNGGPFTQHGSRFGHGPVVHRPFHGLTSPGLHSGPGVAPHKLQFGPGPVRLHHGSATSDGVVAPHKLQFGPGPVRLHHGPASDGVIAREYPESDNMFERDFEDAEFDARDFDELYLD